MKRFCFLFVGIVFFMFSACSSGSDKEDEDDELEFIQLRVTSEDTPTPNGNVYLFKVNGYDIKSETPLFFNYGDIAYTPTLTYKSNGEDKTMIPISEYGKKNKGDLLLNENEKYSTHTFYWYQLSSIYGTPKPGDEYLVFIVLRGDTYAKTSKRFTVTKNSKITVKLPTCKEESRFVEGEWSISDYKQ